MQAAHSKPPIDSVKPTAPNPARAGSAHPAAAGHWLGLQCTMLQGISRGLLFRISANGQESRLEASWPEPSPISADQARRVLLTAVRNKTHLEKHAGDEATGPGIRLYQPLTAGGKPYVVVLDMSDRDKPQRQTVANLLRWNSEWLNYALDQCPQATGDTNLQEIFSAAAACLDQQTFRGSATTLVTRLAARFGCQRVSLGLRKGRRILVQVLSHSARFQHESNLIQAISAAMDEAVDQDRTVLYPPPDARAPVINQAHAELAKQLGHGNVCSIPITAQGEILGALTLERDSGQPLTEADVLEIEQLVALVAPGLWLQHRDEQALPVKAGRSLRGIVTRLFGPEHIKLKLACLGAVILLVFFSFAQGAWRVTAKAVVEGSVQRTVAAPIDGYISSVEVGAGDLVSANQLMGALDESDVRLQRLKWSTLRRQMVSESREAMAQHNRAEVSIISAKIDQADAELELIDEQLARTRLVAPFDGMVIEGDLSQRLGTPVSRGDVLFKVAPMDDYRIVLKVDEQDIAPVAPGQPGKLILASMPSRVLELRVDKITPVSTAEGGRNFFRVEASLLADDLLLQPGMEGVGKITVSEANLFWIWTHDLANWLRLRAWTWWR